MLLLMSTLVLATDCVYKVGDNVPLINIDKDCDKTQIQVSVNADETVRVWQNLNLGMVGYYTFIELPVQLNIDNTNYYASNSNEPIRIVRNKAPIFNKDLFIEPVVVTETIVPVKTNTCESKYVNYPSPLKETMLKAFCGIDVPVVKKHHHHRNILPPNGGAS